MEPTDEHLSLVLTEDQIERIAKVILDQYGKGLGKTHFNDAALGVFENIAGLDGLTSAEVRKLLVRVCYER